MHRTYVGRLERGESGVTVDSLAAILAPLGVSLSEFVKPFKQVVRPPVTYYAPAPSPLVVVTSPMLKLER